MLKQFECLMYLKYTQSQVCKYNNNKQLIFFNTSS